jgi:hypothetical protein
MKGQTLILKFFGENAFLTDEVALDFNQVDISDVPVYFKSPAFWTIQVISYNEIENKIFVSISDYQVGETEFPPNQIVINDQLNLIDKIKFKSVDTNALFITSNGERAKRILPPKSEYVFRSETPKYQEEQSTFDIARFKELITEKVKTIKTYNKPFYVYIKNVTFFNGGISFEKNIPELGVRFPVKFQILNEHIIEEYDSVKNYFSNYLKTKKIQVHPNVVTTDGIITTNYASSPEINRIDKTFVVDVKFEFVKSSRKNDMISDNQLYTVNEYFETFLNKEFNAQNVFENDIDLIDCVLEKSNTKHYNHLRYLSSKHNSDLLKLHIVHKPFSFVFLFNNDFDYFMVWETLDTEEATYLWRFSKEKFELSYCLKIVNEKINRIIIDGKSFYINQKEENFKRVFHDYLDLQNGFKTWKEEIDQIIFIS